MHLRIFKYWSNFSVKSSYPFGFIRMHWSKLENMVFYLSDDELGKTELNSCSVKEFNSKFGTNIILKSVNDLNEYLDKLTSKRITADEYYEFVYQDNTKNRKAKNNKKSVFFNFSIQDMFEKIRKNIVSQDEAIKSLLISIYRTKYFNIKSNILIIGPTGVGKTEMIKSLGKIIDSPVLIEDMTRYTESGYEGNNVEEILVNLYNLADKDIERAQNGIIFLDEIDKKASTGRKRDDFNKASVLKSLLKIIDGEVFNIKVGKYGDTIKFDTSKLIVIAAGAFSELFEEKKNNRIGFGERELIKESSEIDFDIITRLKNYGIPTEFLGRFKTIIRMNSLYINDLVQILKTGELSILNTYLNAFRNFGIELVLDDVLYERIAKLTFSYGTGARSLNFVVNQIFENILYEVFENFNDIEEIVVGPNILDDKSDYVLNKKRR